MKHYTLIISFMLSAVMAIGQSGARFSVQISTDSILMGNSFRVAFVLENAEGSNFKAPELGTYFKVVSGPNTSTSRSFMNGQMSQSVTYTYYLQPIEEGAFYIEPAYIETPENILETSPVEVLVLPNPDGIKQPMAPDFGGGFPQMPGFDGLQGFGDFDQLIEQMQKMFPDDGSFFKMFPDNFNFGSPDSLFFQMPEGFNFFQMPPDSLLKNMPEEWKQLFPQEQPKKKKRKIYKM